MHALIEVQAKGFLLPLNLSDEMRIVLRQDLTAKFS